MYLSKEFLKDECEEGSLKVSYHLQEWKPIISQAEGDGRFLKLTIKSKPRWNEIVLPTFMPINLNFRKSQMQ